MLLRKRSTTRFNSEEMKKNTVCSRWFNWGKGGRVEVGETRWTRGGKEVKYTLSSLQDKGTKGISKPVGGRGRTTLITD